MPAEADEYRHVGSFAQHGHDGMGWLGGVDIYVKAEDYDTHVNYSADAFAIYAENTRLRHDWTTLRDRLRERFEMARGVLDEAGHDGVAVLVPIEEVLIWMDEIGDESGSSGVPAHQEGRTGPCPCHACAESGREPQPGDEVTPEWDDEFIRREEAAERADIGRSQA